MNCLSQRTRGRRLSNLNLENLCPSLLDVDRWVDRWQLYKDGEHVLIDFFPILSLLCWLQTPFILAPRVADDGDMELSRFD
jgi:hypothetical protein